MKREPRKMRGIRPLADGRYLVTHTDCTKRKRREIAGTWSMAVALLHKRKAEALEGKKLPENLRRTFRFEELANDALQYSKAHKRSYVDDCVRMAKLKQWIGDRPADSVTPQEIELWLSGKAEELKPATLNRYRALLSLTYRLGMQNGKVSSNPARLVRQRPENNCKIRFLLPDEEEQLRKVIRSECLHHEAELDVALNTGLRRGEQYGLTWDCVDFDRRLLTIRQSKNRETRHVALNDAAISALRLAEAYKNGSQYVFQSSSGTRLQSPRFWFNDAIRKAKVRDFTWHCLRHTFASRLVMAGVDLRTVAGLMGHKTIQMTMRYAHLAPQHNLAAVQRLCHTGSVQNEASDTKSDTNAEARM